MAFLSGRANWSAGIGTSLGDAGAADTFLQGRAAAAFGGGNASAVAGLFAGLLAGLAGVAFVFAGIKAVFFSHGSAAAAGTPRRAGDDFAFVTGRGSRLPGLQTFVSGTAGFARFIPVGTAVGDTAEFVGT